jgi:hypothetical protein
MGTFVLKEDRSGAGEFLSLTENGDPERITPLIHLVISGILL